MTRIVFYNSKSKRIKELQTALVLGETLIHDDFVDSDGNATNSTTKGRLEFDIVPIVPDLNFILRKTLTAKIRDGTITFPELVRYLQLTL